jgi:hypothetical protein
MDEDHARRATELATEFVRSAKARLDQFIADGVLPEGPSAEEWRDWIERVAITLEVNSFDAAALAQLAAQPPPTASGRPIPQLSPMPPSATPEEAIQCAKKQIEILGILEA